MRSPFPKRLPFRPFFQMVRHARPMADMAVRPPEDSPGSLSAHREWQSPPHGGLFCVLRATACPKRAARGELHTGYPNRRTCLTETGARHTGPPVRHQPSLTRHSPAGVSRPRFRPASLSPPLRAYHEAASVGQPHESLRHRCPGIPKHAFTSRHPQKTVLCTESVPAACLQPA